jgi:hypothetical protein
MIMRGADQEVPEENDLVDIRARYEGFLRVVAVKGGGPPEVSAAGA